MMFMYNNYIVLHQHFSDNHHMDSLLTVHSARLGGENARLINFVTKMYHFYCLETDYLPQVR